MTFWHGGRPWLALFILGFSLSGCHSLRLTSPGPPDKPDKPDKADKPETALAAPSKHSLRVSQFVFVSDFELKADMPLFKELTALRDQIYKELQLPPGTTLVQVCLFDTRERYEAFMHAKYPQLPRRRAFFVAQERWRSGPEDLLVYTYWGDRAQQDLRHELTHGILHSVLRDVPMWLDEGLAEYYELPPDWRGVNPQHLDVLRQSGLQPDLARLEELTEVQQMTPVEYRESWAWVHLMLQGKPEAKTVLLAYLQQLRTNRAPGPLRPRLAAAVPALDDTLLRHLAKLGTRPPPSTAQR
jgi:hypothetical protein